jgi:uncharacterized integral membrane protein
MKNISLLLVIVIILAELVAIWLLDLPEGWPRGLAFLGVVLTGVVLYAITHKKSPPAPPASLTT